MCTYGAMCLKKTTTQPQQTHRNTIDKKTQNLHIVNPLLKSYFFRNTLPCIRTEWSGG